MIQYFFCIIIAYGGFISELTKRFSIVAGISLAWGALLLSPLADMNFGVVGFMVFTAVLVGAGLLSVSK